MPRYSTIISTLVTRITAHCAASQILAGFTFVSNPKTQIEGRKDLPSVRLIDVTIAEKANAHGQTIVADGSMTIKLGVGTDIEAGIDGHILAVEKVMDAVEMNASAIDLLLGATLAQPLSMSAGESFTTQESYSRNTVVTITCVPKAVKSGARRS